MSSSLMTISLLALLSAGDAFTTTNISPVKQIMHCSSFRPSSIETLACAAVRGFKEPLRATKSCTEVAAPVSIWKGFSSPHNIPSIMLTKRRTDLHKVTAGVSPVVMTIRGLSEERYVEQHARVTSKTSNSAVGQAALVHLFALADTNRDGKLNREELEAAADNFGFTWIKDDRLGDIFKGGNGTVTFIEFARNAPNSLKMNLAKHAKEDGNFRFLFQ
uniref:EF-hand domain-containing protein n=1 Tax=Odontella aurita TaxID=265563 RepID=A0A7S4JQS7_9STRA|mmetsp:Transcript_51957/g.155937  ORF Transcript_51957/g.155937 Transcript_51957/m.155937 type:complete len:218 (+) Transcript_51957:196-849(+)